MQPIPHLRRTVVGPSPPTGLLIRPRSGAGRSATGRGGRGKTVTGGNKEVLMRKNIPVHVLAAAIVIAGLVIAGVPGDDQTGDNDRRSQHMDRNILPHQDLLVPSRHSLSPPASARSGPSGAAAGADEQAGGGRR